MFKMDGFDGFKNEMNKLSKRAQKMHGKTKISFGTLFNESFMARFTSYRSLEDFLAYGGFIVNSEEDFDAIPDDLLDKYISEETTFDSWEEMQEEALAEYTLKQLGL